jgi:type II restriction/modification system DNA methylase subunit YeeA
MTPEAFITRWKNNDLTERGGAQTYFIDLCDLLGVEKPGDSDNYCFERDVKKASGGNGWADVWKRGCFGWENKKPGRDLKAALKQLTDYALNLGNPPLLVVCDREIIEIHTAFTGYPDEPKIIRIEELADEGKRQMLKWVFTEPERLRPEKSSAAITGEVAGQFASLAETMRARGLDGQRVAHFLVQCLFAMFAEDEELLPKGIFSALLTKAALDPEKSADRLSRLFTAMRERAGVYGDDDIAWFNGGLFENIDIPPLSVSDLESLREAAQQDWRAIDPSIFGTLFERGLDAGKRTQLGAHYTDAATIEKIISLLISEPLLQEWKATRKEIEKLAPKFGHLQKKKEKSAVQEPNKALKQGQDLLNGFLLRLENFHVLDPACGSGNFLYLSLHALREVERRVRIEAEELGLPAALALHTGPHNVRGLEISEYAAELARVTVWIGDIQWCRRNGYLHAKNPILRSLSDIENRDALLNPDGREAAWPEADVIVGNPPFLGDKIMRSELGDAYVDTLRKTYGGRVPGGADLVTYWFEKARAHIAAGKLQAAGLVATNSIRGGANRKVLDRVCETTRIFTAWNDEPWINEGAAVRVSLVCFGGYAGANLNGQEVAAIHADLTAGKGLNATEAKQLPENAHISFMGTTKVGAFDIPGDLARHWLSLPNPHGKPNSDVVRPWANGMDLTRRPSDTWIIDFGADMRESEAALYETPFQYVVEYVKSEREKNNREAYRKFWWRHGEARPAMRGAFAKLPRFIATSSVAKHRTFVWLPTNVCPDHALIVFARADDTTFGILSSRFHELWSLRLGTSLEDRPRYTPTTCFETFPFPEGMTPADSHPVHPVNPVKKNSGQDEQDKSRSAANPPQSPLVRGEANPPSPEKGRVGEGFASANVAAKAIDEAAVKLDALRKSWLNPPEWVDWVRTEEEAAAGFPHRPVARPGHARELGSRTLTNLYNLRPAWLDLAHRELDAAVAAAYGWTDYTPEMPDAEILKRLLRLNLERSQP